MENSTLPRTATGALKALWLRGESAFDWVVLSAGIMAVGWLWIAHQPPGYAIGVLTLVAAVMAFSQPTAFQRAIVVILAGTLFYLETRSIGEDRSNQQREAKAQLDTILRDNRAKTASILLDNQERFSATESRFSEMTKQAANTIDTVTGGRSYLYMEPMPIRKDGSIGFIIWNNGNYTLTGVSVAFRRITETPWGVVSLQVGTLPAREFSNSTFGVTPKPGKDGIDKYWITLGAQNGIVSERLDFRKNKNGEWEHEIVVDKVKLPVKSMNPNDSAFHQGRLYTETWNVSKKNLDEINMP